MARPDIEAAARRWISQDPARRGGNPDVAQRHFVSHATCWLRFSGRLEDSAISTHPHSVEVADFVDYMRQERGWSEATIRDCRARADDFLRRFCARNGALAEATIATIDRALNENNARTGRPRCRTTIRTHADALRAFFRFAEDRGWSRPGVALRAGDIVNLRLIDTDWDRAVIHVSGKSRRETAYGEAGIPAGENREGRERVAAEPERYLEIPGLDHGEHHEILRRFLRSDWTGDDARCRRADEAYSGSIGRWKRDVGDEGAVHAFHAFQEERIVELAEEFLRENTIVPEWR